MNAAVMNVVYSVLMRMVELAGFKTLLQINSWVTGMAPLLEMHRSDK
jgi:hypothetical protein